VIVRLLHDPTLLAQLYELPEETRLRLKLTPEEFNWFIGIDRRRWEVDSELPHRSLEGALSHCPVTALLVSSLCHHAQSVVPPTERRLKSGVEELLVFYQQPAFHQCIEQGDYLAESLMRWVKDSLTKRALSPKLDLVRKITCTLIDMEVALAEQRRTHYPSVYASKHYSEIMPHPQDLLDLPPHCHLYPTQEGVTEVYLALYEEALKIARTHGRAQLLKGQLDLSVFPIQLDHSITALIERTPTGVSIEPLSSGLATVLKQVQSRSSVAELTQVLLDAEVSPDDVNTMIMGWVKEGLILPG